MNTIIDWIVYFASSPQWKDLLAAVVGIVTFIGGFIKIIRWLRGKDQAQLKELTSIVKSQQASITEQSRVVRDMLSPTMRPERSFASRYTSLNLAPTSPLLRSLHEHFQVECDQPTLALTPNYGDLPPYLTAGMAVWYARNVRPARLNALAQVFSNPASLPAELTLALENDKAELKANLKLAARKAQDPRLLRIRAEIEFVQAQFDALRRKEGGYYPKATPIWFYWALLVFIAPAVSLTVSGTMTQLFDPAIATAITLIISAQVVLCGHIVGRIVKQRRALFASPGRGATIIQGLYALALILTGVAFVVWSRYVTPLQTEGYEVTNKIMVMLPGAVLYLISFVIATLVSFFFHERTPNFAEVGRHLVALRSAEQHLVQMYEKQAIDSSKNPLFSGQLDPQRFGSAYESLANKDLEVLKVLSDYKRNLIARCRHDDRFGHFWIANALGTDIDTGEMLSLAEYEAKPLKLRLFEA